MRETISLYIQICVAQCLHFNTSSGACGARFKQLVHAHVRRVIALRRVLRVKQQRSLGRREQLDAGDRL
ncbi:hypothetical protein IHE32_06825 [Mycetohabitans rhizoxinica]